MLVLHYGIGAVLAHKIPSGLVRLSARGYVLRTYTHESRILVYVWNKSSIPRASHHKPQGLRHVSTSISIGHFPFISSCGHTLVFHDTRAHAISLTDCRCRCNHWATMHVDQANICEWSEIAQTFSGMAKSLQCISTQYIAKANLCTHYSVLRLFGYMWVSLKGVKWSTASTTVRSSARVLLFPWTRKDQCHFIVSLCCPWSCTLNMHGSCVVQLWEQGGSTLPVWLRYRELMLGPLELQCMNWRSHCEGPKLGFCTAQILC